LIVVDASIIAFALGDDGGRGDRARDRLSGEDLSAPEIIYLEVISAWRGALRSGQLKEPRADQALVDLAELPLSRAPHEPLIPRVWELRNNLTPYDAAYVALAESINAALVTADRRLAKAPGLRCKTQVLD
jgi:predicted nucleic acid-binding protein